MILHQIFRFYVDGFKEMSPRGRKLWIIILIKLFVMFAILKPFFFPKTLEKFETEEEKVEFIEQQLIPKK